MISVRGGDVFYATHPKFPTTPHWFVVVSDRSLHRRCLAVMVTDARNIVPPPLRIPAGTTVSSAFRLSKESTIHNAVAYLLRWEEADELVDLGVFSKHGREANRDLVPFGRRVLDDSDEWEDDVNEYVLNVDWTAEDVVDYDA